MSIIMSRAPFRISFFGGGSDYPVWFKREPGAVLSAAIDKYIYISCRYLPPFLGIKHRIVWRHVELIDSIAEILHPAVREGLRYLEFDDSRGIELHYQGDLPARSGMGSSSTFIVALLQTLSSLRGHTLSKEALAQKAIQLEQQFMNETVGSQDQVAAAYGGLNEIRFHQDGRFDVNPLNLRPEREQELLDRLMLFYPGRSRFASDVAKSFTENLAEQGNTIRRMVEMVTEGSNILHSGDLADFGRLLHEAWQLKRSLSDRVSSSDIDDVYARARSAGAIGGKLLGAGGAGFVLFYVERDRQKAVLEALTPQCINVPFKFDHEGSRIIYRADGAQDYQWQ